MLWFEDMYEHCHNSHNPDFAFVDSLTESLEKLKAKQQKMREAERMKSDLMQNLQKRCPVLQSELLASYTQHQKSQARKILTEFERNNFITKAKQSNSYLIDLAD